MSMMEERIKRALAKKPSCIQQLDSKQLDKLKQEQQELAKVMRATSKAQLKPQVVYPPASKNSLFIAGSIVGISGYDNLVYEITKGLYSLGVDVRLNATGSFSKSITPKYFHNLIHVKNPADNEIIVMPPPMINRWKPEKNSIIFTMWESDHLEPPWVNELNKALALVVPSQWAIDTFQQSGVTVPIHKIPLGYDPLIFHPQPTFPEICTFGTAATLTAGGVRKNTSKILDIFLNTFKGIDDVRLKIKISPVCPFPECKDPRVEIIRKLLPPSDLADWYNSLTVFINGSFAEGFGLHLLEAMACGRSLISTKYSAINEYFDDSVGYSISHRLVKANKGQYTGMWAEPNENAIAERMWDVYKNQEQARILGERAAAKAKKMFWKDMGQKLFNVLSDYKFIA